MKTISFFVFLVTVSFRTFCQQTASKEMLTKQEYLQKSKEQKTSAFVLLGLGSASLAIAAPGKVSMGTAGILVIGGGAAIVASIPLFIAAGKNKKKAMSMSFRFQEMQSPQYNGLAEKKIPSLSIKLHL